MNLGGIAKQEPRNRIRWPLFQGIVPFDKSRLVPDVMAGITLAALGIPEVMGYTKIIGTPVITGLYTMLLPVVVFALFGSSRHLGSARIRLRRRWWPPPWFRCRTFPTRRTTSH